MNLSKMFWKTWLLDSEDLSFVWELASDLSVPEDITSSLVSKNVTISYISNVLYGRLKESNSDKFEHLKYCDKLLYYYLNKNIDPLSKRVLISAWISETSELEKRILSDLINKKNILDIIRFILDRTIFYKKYIWLDLWRLNDIVLVFNNSFSGYMGLLRNYFWQYLKVPITSNQLSNSILCLDLAKFFDTFNNKELKILSDKAITKNLEILDGIDKYWKWKKMKTRRTTRDIWWSIPVWKQWNVVTLDNYRNRK